MYFHKWSLRKVIAVRTRPVFVLTEADNEAIDGILFKFDIETESRIKKYRYASLLLRLKPKISEEDRILINKIHDQLESLGQEPIPLLQQEVELDVTLQAFLELHKDVSVRLEESMTGWKKEEMKFDKRPGFLARQEDGVKYKPIVDILKTGQHVQSLPEKYKKTESYYDIATRQYVEVQESATDHVDSWDNIKRKVQLFLSSINQLPIKIRKKVIRLVQTRYRGKGYFFTKRGQIKASQYLSVCLYNFPDNLMLMRGSENRFKSNKEVEVWLREKYASILTDEKIDRSGFMLSVRGPLLPIPENRSVCFGQLMREKHQPAEHVSRLGGLQQSSAKTREVTKMTSTIAEQASPNTQGRLKPRLAEVDKKQRRLDTQLRNERRRIVAEETGKNENTEPLLKSSDESQETSSRSRSRSHSKSPQDGREKDSFRMEELLDRLNRVEADRLAEVKAKEEALAKAEAEAQARAAAEQRISAAIVAMSTTMEPEQIAPMFQLTTERVQEIIAQHSEK